MSQTTATVDNGTEYTQEDAVLGGKIVGWTLNILGWCAAAAIAWSFSGFWMVLLAYIISSLVIGLLNIAIAIGLGMCVPESGFAAIGKAAFSVQNTVTGWFTSSKA